MEQSYPITPLLIQINSQYSVIHNPIEDTSMKAHPTQPLQSPRTVEQVIAGRLTSDGAGVKLTRVIGQSLHRRLDPFLMLDAFRSESAED